MRAALRQRLLSSPLAGPASVADKPDAGREAIRRIASRLLEPLVPRPRVRTDLRPDYATIGVYRQHNGSRLHDFLAGGGTSGDVLLWALDAPHDALADRTLGTGPGTRFTLLNRLVAQLGPAPDRWLVVADDDVVFTHGTPDEAVALAALAALDVSQPSHVRGSHLNWDVSRHRIGSRARLVRYVDQGPLLILSPLGQRRVLPFPESLGMGWGVEVLWAAEGDMRMGVLDGVRINHLIAAGGHYNVDEQWEQAERLREAHGWPSWADLQRETARWRSRSPLPPWL